MRRNPYGSTQMESGAERYQEFVVCDADTESCLIFIKVVSLPHLGAIEFNTTEARSFAERILLAVEKVEKQMERWDAPNLEG